MLAFAGDERDHYRYSGPPSPRIPLFPRPVISNNQGVVSWIVRVVTCRRKHPVMHRSRSFRLLAVMTVALGAMISCAVRDAATAADVTLKSGMVLRGTPSDVETLLIGPRKADLGPITIYPIVMVSSPLKRYFIPKRQNDDP